MLSNLSSMDKFPLLLLSLFTLIFLAQSRQLYLLPSDFKALSLIHRDLGLPDPAKNPCNSIEIFCGTRIGNTSYILRITRLIFESQNLNGRLSPAIGQLSELKELSLQNNNLVGQIPPQIVNCKKLEVLHLSANRFSGEIPLGLSALIRLKTLDLSSNKFAGNFMFLKYFPNLENLNLADNLFTGKVPASLKSCRNLQFINFSGNSFLEGAVPITESIPKRYIFAESKNQTTDIAPASAIGTAPSPAPQGPQPTEKKKEKRKKKLLGWALGFVAGIIAGCVSGLVFTLVFKIILLIARGRDKDSSLKIFSPMIKNPEDLAFLEKEDGLASLAIIGRGGCGEVYKAVLPGSNGREIAIKKIIQPPVDADDLAEEDSKLLTKKMRQIKSEIQTVGQIRHRNLLPLLAHLPRPDCHYLVYEYMKNGSLQDCLHEVTQGRRELDWLARYKIALGVAAGLEYLHISHTPRIIHRDLKPANVLLDDEMEARIADFGLAKAVPDAHTHVTTSNVAGTVGYIAPEYYQTFKFTDKCDIYSYGVLLGALVIGKLPSDEFFQHTDEMSLVKWMRNVMSSEDPKRAIDPRLLGNGYEEQMLLVLKVACFCSLENPKERPNSKDARCMLSQIKH